MCTSAAFPFFNLVSTTHLLETDDTLNDLQVISQRTIYEDGDRADGYQPGKVKHPWAGLISEIFDLAFKET